MHNDIHSESTLASVLKLAHTFPSSCLREPPPQHPCQSIPCRATLCSATQTQYDAPSCSHTHAARPQLDRDWLPATWGSRLLLFWAMAKTSPICQSLPLFRRRAHAVVQVAMRPGLLACICIKHHYSLATLHVTSLRHTASRLQVSREAR